MITTKFQVVVGNIGTVYSGNNYQGALCKFRNYVALSKLTRGPVAGENVTLLHNDEIREEYTGSLEINSESGQ